MLDIIKGDKNIMGLSIDTDGIDGNKKNAGAFFSSDTYKKAKNLIIELSSFQLDHLNYHLLNFEVFLPIRLQVSKQIDYLIFER